MKKYTEKKNILLRAVVIYIPLLFCIIAITVGWISMEYTKALMDETKENSKMLLKRAKQDISMRLDLIDTEAIKLLNNNDIIKMFNNSNDDVADVRMDRYNAIKALSNVRMNTAGIKSIYFIPNDTKYIISDTMGYLKYEFPYFDEVNIAREQKSKSLILSNRNENDVVHLRAYPPNATKERIRGYIQFNIDENYLYREFKNNVSENSEVFILDGDDYIITCKDKSLIGEKFQDKYDIKNESSSEYRIGNSQYVVFADTAELFDWKYIVFTDIKEISATVNSVNSVILLIGIIVFFFAAILVFFASKLAFKSVNNFLQNTIKKIQKSNNSYIFTDSNSFDNIENAIEKMIVEGEQLKELMKESLPARKWKFVESIITGVLTDISDITSVAATLGLKFYKGSFGVMVAEFGNLNDENKKICGIAFCRMLEEKSGTIAIENTSGSVITIFSSIKFSVNFKEEILEIVEKCAERTKEIFDVDVIMGLGTIGSQSENLKLSYKEALECLEYKFVIQTKSVISYDELSKYDESDFYRLLMRINKISSIINSGNANELNSFIDTVFNYVILRNLPSDKVQMIISQMIYGAVNAASSVGISFEKINAENFSMDVSDYNDIVSVRTKIIEILESVLFLMADRKAENKSDVVMERVLKYLNEKYQDPSLSIALLSQKVNMSITYIINGIKEATGKSYYEYITELRMNEAKRLLLETHEKIYEIANKVGYENPQSFIRTFKKNFGYTPEAYRKNNDN